MFGPERSDTTLPRRPETLRGALVLVAATLLLGGVWTGPAGAVAQQVEQPDPQPLVAHEVSVSGDEAALRLEFYDGERLEASLREGVLTLDGRELGDVPPDSPLAGAWRELLGALAPLGPSEAAERLQDWELPDDLDDTTAEAGQFLRETLSGAVAADPADAAMPEDLEDAEPDALSTLLGRPDRLAQLPLALEGIDLDDPRLYVGRNVRIEADEDIAGGLVVLDGNLVLEGRVDGHVVVLGGSVDLEEGASVTGNLTVSDGQVRGERGVVAGSIVEGVEGLDAVEPGAVQEAVEEAVAEAEAEAERDGFALPDVFAPITYLGSGIASLIRLAIVAGLLALVGLGLLHFAPRNLDLAGRATREDAGRSALVGLATVVLAFPLWVAGIVALAVSVIGIPLLLIWLPFFWAALGLVAAFGFVAVSYQVGEALDESRFEAMDWIRGRSAFHHLATGVVVLLAPFVLAAVVSMVGPVLAWLEVLLQLVGWLMVVAATTIGTGAVLLTRGGRRPSPGPPVEEPAPGSGAFEEPVDEPAWSAAGAPAGRGAEEAEEPTAAGEPSHGDGGGKRHGEEPGEEEDPHGADR